MTKQIRFENKVQAALFQFELLGQISDGYWENSKPGDHWQVFTRVEVVVDPANPGMTGIWTKRKYNFAAPMLVDVVGDRMVNIANLAHKGYDGSVVDRFNMYWDQFENPGDHEYWKKKAADFAQIFGNYDGWATAVHGEWDLKQVKKELKRMSEIVNGLYHFPKFSHSR
jgi:hypothetical protein